MSNDKILQRYLRPTDASKEDFWKEFLHKSATDPMLWYPSAKDTVRDLLLKPFNWSGELIHTHTDYFPHPAIYKLVYGKSNSLLRSSLAQFRLVDFAELEFLITMPDVEYDKLPQRLAAAMASALGNKEKLKEIKSKEQKRENPEGMERFLHQATLDEIAERAQRPQFLMVNRGLLLKMFVDDGHTPEYQRYILYLFIDDVTFMERFIVEEKLKLSHIWNGYYV